jgi:hypothetical protein
MGVFQIFIKISDAIHEERPTQQARRWKENGPSFGKQYKLSDLEE